MAKCRKAAWLAAVGLILPFISHAQGIADEMKGLHGVLEQLYDEMMPLCSQLIGVGQGLAGFAAMWYIASRVWGHLSRAEPIDFYPLFRPFVIGFCVLFFPTVVLGVINGVMKPTVTATAAMVEGSDKAIAVLLQKKEEAIKKTDVWQMYVGESGSGDRDKWYKYTHDNEDPSDEGFFESIGNDIKFAMSKASYNFRNSVKEWMSEVLRVLFEAASLCIDTLRTFQLIVLAILGPLVFGIAVFDGFQHTLTVWIARYINIFLWLPVANIFGSIIGKIQEKMLELDISQVQDYGDTFFSRTDMAYLVFMIIGIIGYFTVPSVANYIVHAGGGGALGHKVTSLFGSSSRTVVNTASAGAGMAVDAMGSAANRMSQSMASSGASNPYFGDSSSGNSGYMNDKLKGNS
ncbi:conjugative transposon protein TraJ [Terrimonas sp.]|jgi:conjugative transposon TraJ protein|uniref:conjugative transposon protein TraJ n=1 Tax=Chitinophagaceae TaxID=563835 RepID=UPI0006BBDCE0|nr:MULTISPECIES: conjugative transposon protein TraJ [Chitinophagaceae]MBN8859326.1 conjugative transposon protein TraJ [Sphingobacteriales bacterium]MBN9484598.1 conjugative transposon protein TraJ [Bacteroidota bacterium]OJW42261.1 MAG: conjugative transposon protein TraJ [Sphingobacteriales bacterium 48-107]OJW81552.1 MAG: conjugative transposon protein TraJ [Bacteroidetes bacterium 46-16]MBN8783878.1 conjugative transposon protein TraJ [Terrimonas ferruginea]